MNWSGDSVQVGVARRYSLGGFEKIGAAGGDGAQNAQQGQHGCVGAHQSEHRGDERETHAAVGEPLDLKVSAGPGKRWLALWAAHARQLRVRLAQLCEKAAQLLRVEAG